MYLRDLADSLLRRWILVVVLLAMTGGTCFAVSKAITPTYETNASVVLVPPKNVIQPKANRFLELSSLTQAADVLARSLNGDTTHEQVDATVGEGSYEVTDDVTTSAPVLLIMAKAPTASEADALIDAVLAQAPASLSALQESLSIARDAEITAIPVERDVEPTLNRKTQMRAVVALGVLMLGGGAMLIGALDGMLLVRSAMKQLRRQREGGGDGAKNDVDTTEDVAWLEELAGVSSRPIFLEPVVNGAATANGTTPVTNGAKRVPKDARPLADAANHQQAHNGVSRGLAGASDRERE
ncbi:MAG: hypothetical protein ABWX74_10545 [Aeromicrobium sp.]